MRTSIFYGLKVVTSTVAELCKGNSSIPSSLEVSKVVIECLFLKHDRVCFGLRSIVLNADLGAASVENRKVEVEIIVMTTIFLIITAIELG